MASWCVWNSGVSHSQSATLIRSESDFRNALLFHLHAPFVVMSCVVFIFVDTFRIKLGIGSLLYAARQSMLVRTPINCSSSGLQPHLYTISKKSISRRVLPSFRLWLS